MTISLFEKARIISDCLEFNWLYFHGPYAILNMKTRERRPSPDTQAFHGSVPPFPEIPGTIAMESTINNDPLHRRTSRLLHQLGCPVHRIGFRQLCVAIPMYARGEASAVCKELYPLIARNLGSSDWRAVERSIRCEILDGWKHGNPEMWERFFPGRNKAPSNKEFICTMAELITSRLDLSPDTVPLHRYRQDAFFYTPSGM